MLAHPLFEIPLDRHSSQPLYQQIKLHIMALIEGGELPPLTRLPATRLLAKELGVNRITVVTAYAELSAEGYISSQVGRGSFVLDRAMQPSASAPPPPSLRNPADWNAHQFSREMMRLARRHDILSFAPGMPATDLLPVEAYRLALNTVLRSAGSEVLQYGPIEGYPALLQAITTELASFAVEAQPAQLLITSGAEQALALVLRTLLRQGDHVLLESPTYLHVLDLLASSGIHVHLVESDEEGMVIEHVEELISRYQPRLLYLTPTYQNPTGVCMPLAHRQQLVELAAKYELLLLEDDVYRHLWLQRPPPPPLRALDTSDNVIYVNGYSKCLLPGARIGYLLAPARLYPPLSAAHQTLDIAASELNQRALAVYLRQGQFLAHLEQVRRAHRARLEAMQEALTAYMPAGTNWTVPRGGLFTWVQLPWQGPSATTVYVHALELGVTFAPGHLFYPGPPSDSHHLRLN
ncbi:MAG: PLP-dependent aminotransferase family protein, partial [Chloroflexi bacterium]|nr:PLP-dependent aminotransferase family protein [Chloroflexota bacterium]